MQNHDEVLRLACRNNDTEKVKQMLGDDDMELPDDTGRTLLHHAGCGGSVASAASTNLRPLRVVGTHVMYVHNLLLIVTSVTSCRLAFLLLDRR